MRALFLIALAIAPITALADFTGRVVKVSDGDTLTILDAAKQQHKVRLDAIDAPELKQAFGQRSRQSLADICGGKSAEVAERGKDRYGRTIGRVTAPKSTRIASKCGAEWRGHIRAMRPRVHRSMS